ncbi:hypothetical protein SELMODRAFT_184503 [Selaginella moellendorffii]|uniref:STAS domain-containing protein n=1 Tax=Selaginella moellendorffii TaxID=88036 RepID=D8T175_SELML|nr:sulfate transporter 1.3 [Selaginella moellendorffii]EFJ09638.1 hypothetical protein SELMODRAFT_184503 [Selaginella moellendorffii]|eukprot:XP_002989364.1 sulfate transporter 1.3 [Selaginella moellendorffii]
MAGSVHTDDSDSERAARKPSDGQRPEELPFVHKVSVPPSTPLHSGIKDTIKETFFPDDPFLQFKNQTKGRKFVLAILYVFPILEWGPKYRLNLFKRDFVSGLTIASLCIPQAMAYAKLAHLPPEYGLYSDVIPPFVYAVLGSSRHIVVGPVAVVSILLGTLLNAEVNYKKDLATYLQLTFTATFFAGLIQAGLGILRLGFIIDFLSHAAVVGFMAGAAITIGLQQLKGLFGITDFTTKTDIVSVLKSVFSHTHQWNWQTILIGLFFLVLLLAAKFISKRKKSWFWISAIAPLTAVILSTAFVKITRVDRHGVITVKHINKGLNPSSAHLIHFSGDLALKGVKVGIVAGLVALTEAIAVARTFAALKDYHIDGNKEMIALGSMNMIGSLSSSYVTTGSFSRSAVNYNSGCQTAISNVVMAVVVMIVLRFLTPLFFYTPNCILASIIITAVLSLIDLKAAKLIWKIDKSDFLACMGAFFGVVFVSVEIGLLVAVCISMAKILLYVTRPHTAVLGNIPGTTVYRNVQQYPEAYKIPGTLLVRIDAAIYFSNSNYIRERVLRYVNEEEEVIKKANGTSLQYVIVDLTPVMSIDTTGIHAFEELLKILRKRGLQLAIANPGSDVMEKLHIAKFLEELGEEWVFLTVGQAVQVCTRLLKSADV